MSTIMSEAPSGLAETGTAPADFSPEAPSGDSEGLPDVENPFALPKQEPSTPILVVLDPAQIRNEANVRKDLELDDDFKASIKQHNVLEPIVVSWAYPSPKLVFGQRRLAAAIEVGLKKIPCYVVPQALAADDLILKQLAENDMRVPVKAEDRAAALFELSSLGWSVTKIAKQARMKPAEVKTALTAAKVSPEAKEAVSTDPTWDLAELAALAEFESDEAALKTLKDAHARGQLHQNVGYLREKRVQQGKREELTAKLAKKGVKILTERPSYDGKVKPVGELYSPGGERFTEQTHAKCPGHRVHVVSDYSGKAVANSYCVAPKDFGHVHSQHGTPKKKQDPNERKLVIERNRMWRADRTRRHEYLVQFFARRTAPEGTARFVATFLANRPYSLRKWIESYQVPLAPAFLKMPDITTGHSFSLELKKQIDAATDRRIPLLQLVTVAAAIEKQLEHPHNWRNPHDNTEARGWFAYLGKAGYELSEFEQAFIDGTTALAKDTFSNALSPAKVASVAEDPDDGEDEGEDDYAEDDEFDDEDPDDGGDEDRSDGEDPQGEPSSELDPDAEAETGETGEPGEDPDSAEQ